MHLLALADNLAQAGLFGLLLARLIHLDFVNHQMPDISCILGKEGLDKVEIVYQTLPGWSEDISKARSFDELPVHAQNYVKMIEDAAGVPVKWIGVGPEREATIRR